MSDIVNPAAPVAAPAAQPAAPTSQPQVSAPGAVPPVQVHVHNAAPQQPAAPAASPAPEAPKPPAAKPPYVNPYARPAPAPAAPPVAAQPAPAASPAAPSQDAPQAPAAQPPAPVVDPQVAALTERLDGLRSVVALTSQREVNALPDNLRAYVLAQAGDDPVRQINAIEGLRSHGLIPAAPQVVPQGANTSPAVVAPPLAPTATNPDASVLAQYEALKAKSPHAAASFLSVNGAAITRARAAARPS